MNREQHQQLLRRVDNWVRAYHVGIVVGLCGSAERRYRPGRVHDGDELVEIHLVDQRDAEIIERAWRTLWTPWAKWLIKWHFVEQFPKAAIVRMLQRKQGHGIRLDSYQREIFLALEMLHDRVDNVERAIHSERHNLIPVRLAV